MEPSVVVMRQTLDAKRMGAMPTLMDILTTTGR